MQPSRAALSVLVLVAVAGFGQEAPKKVSVSEALAAVTTKVSPEYPSMARQLKVEGRVDLEAVVGENGAVEQVNIVSGNPILTRPAAESLKRWKFKPFMADGKPVKALAPVIMNFKL